MSDWFARWFDADYAALYAHRDEGEARRAVKMALRLAPELAAGPVLDLGCGTGRHLQCLRHHNPLAFGLDLSAHLLSLAPGSLAGWLVRGDMRAIPVRDGALWGVCMWFTPFGYFEDAQNRALLARIARLLRPGGILILDFLNARQVREDLVPEEHLEQEGLRVQIRRSLEGPRIVKRITLTRTDGGQVREALESVRLYEPPELEAMARECGLSLLGEVGDYEGLPFREASSPRWIGIFHRPRL